VSVRPRGTRLPQKGFKKKKLIEIGIFFGKSVEKIQVHWNFAK